MNQGAPGGIEAVRLTFLALLPSVLLFGGFVCLVFPRQLVALSILLLGAAPSPRLQALQSEAAQRWIRRGGAVSLAAGAALFYALLRIT
jgi:hypothetical protein